LTSVNWSVAKKVARRAAGTYPLEGTYHAALLARQAPGLVDRAAALVSAETGLDWVGDPNVRVVTRREWAEANLVSFARLFALAERALDTGGIGRRMMGRLVGAEMGALVGVLSRRVLGQYELVLPADEPEDDGDTVMFVGANVLWLERQHEFRPDEFRFWVALHECTHRLQFTGVPWMRDYFLSLVTELVADATPEEGRVQRMRDEMKTAAEHGRPVVDESGIMGLLASPGQKALLDRIQALMALLEGHGHVIMDRIGARELVSVDRMSRALKMRRADPRMAAFMRLTGLEMKMKQYEWGEKFIRGVERSAGFTALDAVWEGPDHLPTLAEIRDPQRWLERVA